MSTYIYAVVLLSILIFVSGIFVYDKYKNTSGIFYLLFSILFPIWFLLYGFSFNASLSPDFITGVYRFQYSLSIIGFYSILFFVLFYGLAWKKFSHYVIPIFLFFITSFVISNGTNLIVNSVEFNIQRGIYVENYGMLFGLFAFLYIALMPFFIGIFIYKFRTLSNLNRSRLFLIVIGFLSFIGISLLSNVFIPYFSSDSSNFYGERVFPFFILPFIFSVFYSSYKYDFSSYKVYLNNISCYGSSLIFTLIWLEIFHIILGYFNRSNLQLLEINVSFGWGEVFLAILMFSGFLKIFKRFHLQNIIHGKLKNIKERLPFITGERNINIFLKNEFQNQLSIQDVILDTKAAESLDIVKFFKNNKDIKYIVNDFVFFQRYKFRFSQLNINNDLSIEKQLIFPIFHENNKLIGILYLGKKPFGDAYTTQELSALEEFALFLAGYLKYLSVYEKLQDISINLDKKVDEKTIQYNNLVSKQREFISYVGHEIKNPITNSIFICDSIKDELENDLDQRSITLLQEDSSLLYNELIKVSQLVKQIFSTEKFDLDKRELYKEKTDLSLFIYEEINVFKVAHPNIVFQVNIGNLGEFDIDITQFRQVIHNLINNAIKFSNNDNPIIYIGGFIQNNKINIIIEDNGKGFEGVNLNSIFDKYETGSGDMVGLGMGLYLCDKILEYHEGTIVAANGDILGGARFLITL